MGNSSIQNISCGEESSKNCDRSTKNTGCLNVGQLVSHAHGSVTYLVEGDRSLIVSPNKSLNDNKTFSSAADLRREFAQQVSMTRIDFGFFKGNPEINEWV